MKKNNTALLPIFFGFFIMGFVDVVGISSSYVKKDFGLSDSLANLLPMMVFLWFAVFSIPTSLLMNSLGRKKIVLVSLAVTFLALIVPLLAYRFETMLLAFALLGIGNTIMQVSLNPLLTNVVSKEKLTSSLTLGQFVKAISSFLGPIIAGVASGTMGDWKMMFPFFAAITLLSGLWLAFTPVAEEKTEVKTVGIFSGFGKSFSLLKDPVILMLFMSIVLVVGVDVGLNTTLPKFLMERASLPLERAGLATSLYFAARTIGTFAGAILLMKVSKKRFFTVSMVLAMIGMALMVFSSNVYVILTMIFCLGLALANVFSIIFSAALQKEPQRANEVSGLLIMGIGGGAIVPPIMGIVSDSTGQTGAMVVLLICLGYLLFNALKMAKD